jgi:hypothetical protein
MLSGAQPSNNNSNVLLSLAYGNNPVQVLIESGRRTLDLS